MRVTIKQTFHVTRTINIDVDADSAADAREQVESGAIDAPAFHDVRWRAGWELVTESVEVAE